MQMPNKLYFYSESTVALIPEVLDRLKDGSVPARELFADMRGVLNDPSDFLSVMDCLYALRAVNISNEGEVYSCLQK